MMKKQSRLGGSFAALLKQEDGAEDSKFEKKFERKIAKELIAGILARAGRGKDDIIQIFCRELGLAFAGILKEPLQRLSESRKVQITIEIVPIDSTPTAKSPTMKGPIAKAPSRQRKSTKNRAGGRSSE